ncbi:hypothetical protein HDC93_006158 [Streptomyces sp. AK010]|nr:hypothetical protein [Streptomyces sp. AK010]
MIQPEYRGGGGVDPAGTPGRLAAMIWPEHGVSREP